MIKKLVALSLVLLLSACGAPGKKPTDAVIGFWQVTSMKPAAKYYEHVMHIEENQMFQAKRGGGFRDQSELKINADNLVVKIEDGVLTITYKLDGDQLFLSAKDKNGDVVEGVYKRVTDAQASEFSKSK